MTESEQRSPESLLPLPDGMFYILLSLSEGEKHGYAIMKEVKSTTGGEVRMGAGTLYTSLGRMLEAGGVELLEDYPKSGNEDERRRYYRITSTGQSLLLAECQRREVKHQRERRMAGPMWPRSAEQSA